MSQKRDLFEVLEVPRSATQEEIKRSYKKLALKWHPDKNPDRKQEAEDKFKEISHAHSVLSNPESRKMYESFGEVDGVPDFSQFRTSGDMFFTFYQRPQAYDSFYYETENLTEDVYPDLTQKEKYDKFTDFIDYKRKTYKRDVYIYSNPNGTNFFGEDFVDEDLFKTFIN